MIIRRDMAGTTVGEHLTLQQSGNVGKLVRARRKAADLGLKQVRDKLGVSEGHLSRFENGRRTLGWDIAAEVAALFDLDAAELVAAAGRVPPAVAGALAEPRLALALVELEGESYNLPARTRLELRRLSVRALVERGYPPPDRQYDRPDPFSLLKARAFSVEFVGAEWVVPHIEVDLKRKAVKLARGEAVDPVTTDASVRFQAAHALGHVEMTTPCAYTDLLGGAEIDATGFAAYFLVPSSRLAATLDRAPRLDPWKADDIGALITFVADYLGAPVWLVARRITEDGVLARRAQVAG